MPGNSGHFTFFKKMAKRVCLRVRSGMRAGCTLMLALGACVPPAYATRVDLQIESITILPPRPEAKKPVTAVATIRNNGSEAAANLDVDVTIRQQDEEIRTIADVPVLSNLPRLGTSRSEAVNLGAFAPGDYELEMTVDGRNKLAETDEKNNSLVKKFHVA